MVKHIVMFRLKGDPEQSRNAAIRFCEALLALPDIIEPLSAIEVGINENPAEQWDIVLSATLNSWPDIEFYAKHPAHIAAAAIIAPFKEARACVDYTV